LRASLSLASLFALRMLGLFLILRCLRCTRSIFRGATARPWSACPRHLRLTQGILQIPFGMASDRWEEARDRAGLLLFAAGSFVAPRRRHSRRHYRARAAGGGRHLGRRDGDGRDMTRGEHRTKAMALMGGSIGLTFALSLVGRLAVLPDRDGGLFA